MPPPPAPRRTSLDGLRGLAASGWVLGVGVASLAAALTAVSAPTYFIGVVTGVVAVLVLMSIPVDRVAGLAASMAIVLLVVVPVQYVKDYGQLKVLIPASAVGLTALVLARRYRHDVRLPRGAMFLGGYYLLLAVTTLWTGSNAVAWQQFSLHVVAGGCLFLLGGETGPAERRGVARTVIALAAVEAVYVVVEVAAGLHPVWGYTGSNPASYPSQIFFGLQRGQGTLAHPLPLAFLLVVALGLVLKDAAQLNRRWRVAVTALLFVGILAAGSRSAFIVAVVLLAFSIARRRVVAVAVGVYLIAFAVVIAAATGFFQTRIYTNFVEGDSLGHRLGAVDAAGRLLDNQTFLNIVLGNGYWSSAQLFRRGLLQTDRFYAVDNQFVLTLAEGGLLCLAAATVFLGLALVRGRGEYRMAILAAVAMLLSFDAFAWPSALAIIALLAGLALGQRAAQARRPGSVTPPSAGQAAIVSS